jgi:hypothetical protein
MLSVSGFAAMLMGDGVFQTTKFDQVILLTLANLMPPIYHTYEFKQCVPYICYMLATIHAFLAVKGRSHSSAHHNKHGRGQPPGLARQAIVAR